MIPPEVAARVRMLAQELQPEAATPRVEAVHRIRPADAVHSDLPRELQQGAVFRATIQRPLPDGTFLALVAGREMTLAIDRALKSGDTLELVVAQREGNTLLARETADVRASGAPSAAAASVANAARQDSATVAWSRTGALLQQLMAHAGAGSPPTEVRLPPVPLTRAIPLPHPPVPAAPFVAPTHSAGAASAAVAILASHGAIPPGSAASQAASAQGQPSAPLTQTATSSEMARQVAQPVVDLRSEISDASAASSPGTRVGASAVPSSPSQAPVAAAPTLPSGSSGTLSPSATAFFRLASSVPSSATFAAGPTPPPTAPSLANRPTAQPSVAWDAMIAQVSDTLQARQAPVLPESLNAAVRTSGLFYESHLAKWLSGAYPLEALRLEPQNLALAGSLAALASSSREPVAAVSTPNERVSLLLRQLFGGATTASDEAAPAAPSQNPANAHIAETIEHAAPLPSRSSALLSPIPERLMPLVQQQLDALALQRFEVSFSPWAGAHAHWLIEKEDHRERVEDEDQQADSATPAAPRWRSRLRLHSPVLGTIECRMTFFSPTDVQLQIAAERSEAARKLQARMADLNEALRTDGIRPTAIHIQAGELRGG